MQAPWLHASIRNGISKSYFSCIPGILAYGHLIMFHQNPITDHFPALRELPRFVLDVDMYIAKYAYALAIISGDYTALQVEQLSEWLYEARRMLYTSGLSLDDCFFRMGQDEAGDIIRTIRHLVQERRDGYEKLRVKWPDWRMALNQVVNTTKHPMS